MGRTENQDAVVSMAAEGSELELCMAEPIIVYDLVLEKVWLKKDELDDMLRPENMTDPREIPK